METIVDLNAFPIRPVLPLLLADKTTGKNIVWATDSYASLGEGFAPNAQMGAVALTGMDTQLLQPRARKAETERLSRTRARAEVFTPGWIVRQMNDALDEARPMDWQAYVDLRALEITCGEAPFITTRYDAVTGQALPRGERDGLLDRKLRAVDENAPDEKAWLAWALRALRSVYGYELQGDSLLLARVNVLSTYAGALRERWGRPATEAELRRAANIIAWNFWQMDGRTGQAPYARVEAPSHQQLSLFDDPEAPPARTSGQPCRVRDWRANRAVFFDPRGEGETARMKFDFVIGNPPYQEEVENNGRKNPLYHHFMSAAYEVADVVELITPARFLFNAGQTPKQWNAQRLNDEHFTVLKYYSDGAEVFPNVEIKGGVAITLRDASRNFGKIGVFTSYEELNSILRKVHTHTHTHTHTHSGRVPGQYRIFSRNLSVYAGIFPGLFRCLD